MLFKQLELSGFKSFAEKTTLVFEPGVTAIVGPNGSGKSNIADSIKWVLGEQSARELRGGRMEDLIFNGTDTRPPQNVAEVTLTFDNTSKRLPIEYEEVAITRRLYRSGESEYLLNKTPVRLKDILELLMGTGIGTSAYSLFEQGKMDQLIHARPEERRAIFEEAAGITKYKTQKREALRKLEQTEANLLRLNDVIGEVRRQLTALERQVRKAEAYREQWERLKTLEVALAQREFHRLQADRQHRDAEAQAIRVEEQQVQQQIAAGEQAAAERRAALERVDQAYAQHQAEALTITHAIETATRQIQTTQERLGEGRRRAEQARQEIEALRRQLAQAEGQIAELAQGIEATESERQRHAAALAEAQQRLAAADAAIQQHRAAIQQRKGAVVESAARTAAVRNDLMKRSSQVHGMQARVQRLALEQTRVAQERAEAADHLAAVEKTLAAHRAQAQQRVAEQAYRQAALVAQTVQPTPGSEQAVAAALEAWAQAIVAGDWETAGRCAASLRAQGQGQATFLVRQYRLTGLTAEASAEALAQAIDAAERQAAGTHAAVTQSEAQRGSLAAAWQKLQDEHTLLASELEEATQQSAELTAQETDARQALARLEQQEADDQTAIAAAQQQIEAEAGDRDAAVLAAAQAEAALAAVDQLRDSRQQSLTVLEQSRRGMEAALAAREREVAEWAARETTWTQACVTWEREIAARQGTETSGRQAVEQVAAQRAALGAELAQAATALQVFGKTLEGVRQRLHAHDLGVAQLAYHQESVATRLRQVYQLAFEPSPEPPAEQDWDAVTRDCEALRRRMEGLGPVSMGSIDESKALQERLTFLTDQQQDLLKAKDDLHAAITTINRTTRAQFKDTFQKIQQEFQATYRTLFGGGEARLVLLDEEDLLESGIEIIARPPGKTPQSIALLSGGEKALTSVALLFAIFRVKPSPFCLLDEIDAPLDEANIDRFTRALKEFLKDSQFIIITHNKKTITMADVMYGVTMEEQGVSTLVSVKLHDTAATPSES